MLPYVNFEFNFIELIEPLLAALLLVEQFAAIDALLDMQAMENIMISSC
jgi:hypothetical protein